MQEKNINNDLVKRWDVFVYLTEYYNHRTELQHDCLKQALSRVPSAEPERKKGKWTIEYSGSTPYKFCCTNCKAHHVSLYHYCPTCGADMRGNEYEIN